MLFTCDTLSTTISPPVVRCEQKKVKRVFARPIPLVVCLKIAYDKDYDIKKEE
jgi:hypothetical protein